MDDQPQHSESSHAPPSTSRTLTPGSAGDITKSKPYAITDLLVKVVSGFAIVVIGIASCRLQKSQDEKRQAETEERQKLDTSERAEKKYLPALRSITEADLVLVEAAADYSWRTHTEQEVMEESRLGTHLAYCGASLFFPDGEPTFGVMSAIDNQKGVANPTFIRIPAHAAVLMLANLMHLSPQFRRLDTGGITIVYHDGELEFDDQNGHAVGSSSVDRRATDAWKVWLPAKGMPLHELFYEVDIDTIANDLHSDLSRTAEEIVKKNPEVLSAEYVKIRDEVLRSRDSLLPRKQ